MVAPGSFFGFFGFFAWVVPEVVAPVPEVVVVAPVPEVVAPVPEVVVVVPVPEVVAPVGGCFLVPPGSFFGLVASLLAVVEPLESGSATATAPPAPPISKPAASTQTPAAKRKCDKPTICSPQPQDSSPAFQRLHIVAWSDHRVYGNRKLDMLAVNGQQ